MAPVPAHTGLTDLPLTDNGEDEARTLAPLLARHTIALALTSPLRRARRTAERAGLRRAQVEPNLHEWDYGGYEGLTTAEICGKRPDWVLRTWKGRPPVPQTTPARARGKSARADLVLVVHRPGPGASALGDVVLVAHGHFLRVLAARPLGLPPAARSPSARYRDGEHTRHPARPPSGHRVGIRHAAGRRRRADEGRRGGPAGRPGSAAGPMRSGRPVRARTGPPPPSTGRHAPVI